MNFFLIQPKDMWNVLREKQGMLIDVRSYEKYKDSHLKGARSGPFEDINVWEKRLRKHVVYVLYCEYGSTSLLAARRLGNEGYQAYTVVGGLHAIEDYWGISAYKD